MTLGQAPDAPQKSPAPATATQGPAVGWIRLWLGLVAAGVFVMILAGTAARPLVAVISAALGDQAGRQAAQSLAAHHALFSRLVGLAFVAPLPWIFWRGRNIAGLAAPLTLIALLGAAQAVSGHQILRFTEIHGAAAYGLAPALHVMLSGALFSVLIFTALGLAPHFRDPLGRDARNFRPLGWTILALILLQFGIGSFGAGYGPEPWRAPDDAPQLFATALASAEFSLGALLGDGAQILRLHRLIAYLLLALMLLHALHLGREKVARRGARRAIALIALCLAQIALGAALFWFGAPPTAALAHQFLALTLLALASAHLRKLG